MQKATPLLLLLFKLQLLCAQHYEIVIKGGHVIDPRNDINEVLDVAVSNGKIASVAKNIRAVRASQVIDARGLYVVPGLIDIHTHDFYGPDPSRAFCDGTGSVAPDSFAFRSGVTTVVDAGSSGWRDFPTFKKRIIDLSKPRVLAFLNIVGAGMRGGNFEQDTTDMDVERAVKIAQQYSDYVVGIKLAHYNGPGWLPVDYAERAGKIANIPVMVDFGESPGPLPIKELFLGHMRPGDIFTHCFAQLKGREPIVDAPKKKLKRFVWDARKKGIVFDVGYGTVSFAFSQAVPAIASGFFPNSLSSDMHAGTTTEIEDLPDIMSRFLAMGMGIGDVVSSVTWRPATEINHQELGHISVGAIADIAILSVVNGTFLFRDHCGTKIEGRRKFECVATIKSGKVVFNSKALGQLPK